MADGFGFDPYLVANLQQMGAQQSNADAQTLGDLITKGTQNQAARWQLGRQQNLADIVSRNAGAFSNPYAQALAQGGFGQEAFDAQNRAFEMGQKILGIHRDIAMSQSGAVKTPEQAEQFIGRMSPDVKSLYGFTGQEKGPEALAAVQRFRGSAITPEEEAKNANEAQKTKQEGFEVKDFDGVPYVVDHVNRRAYALNGAAPSQGGETPAPLGSKRYGQKNEVLNKLAEDLDPTSGKSDLAVKANSMIQAADRLHALAKAEGPMTPQRIHEMVLMNATIANGGNVPTETQVEAMFPQTLRGKGAEFWQRTTGVPQDMNVQPFVDLMLQQSERETKVAKKQIRDYLLGRLPNHPLAFQQFPQEANQMAEAAGLQGLYDSKTGKAIPRVQVRFKGKTMVIPRSRLADALKDGAQEVK